MRPRCCTAQEILAHPDLTALLREPSSLRVRCQSREEMEMVAGMLIRALRRLAPRERKGRSVRRIVYQDQMLVLASRATRPPLICCLESFPPGGLSL